MLGAVHEDAVRYQLPVVLVGSHHIGGDALPSGFGGERAYHVVGFVAGYFEDGNAVGADDVLYNRYGKADGLGCLLALCLVLLVGLVAEGGARRVEGYSYVCGILFLSTSSRVFTKPRMAEVLNPFELILGFLMNA